jgi:hypothetical protein
MGYDNGAVMVAWVIYVVNMHLAKVSCKFYHHDVGGVDWDRVPLILG